MECLQAADHFVFSLLRDLDQQTLESNGVGLPDVIFRRARHVVTENQRTLSAAEALRAGDAATVGRLMVESHESLRDDYEVSTRPLDAMVIAANGTPGCFGARMMGGGFGGVAVALVSRGGAARFKTMVADSYTDITGLPANVHLVEAVDGVVALPGADT